MKLHVAGRTDVGLLSDHNEDCFLACEDLHLYLVADGVGGLQDGELASHAACNVIQQGVRTRIEQDPDPSHHDRVLAEAIQEANLALYEYGQLQHDKRGVGTTITALWFHGDRVLFASVGDSRIYLYRHGRLRRLSRDQKVGRFRLAASLGQDGSVHPHLGMVRLREGDRFLLCTDGLHGAVAERDIAFFLDSYPDPVECCKRLVAKANDAGGQDNITALVAEAVQLDPPQAWRFARARVDATSGLASVCRPPVLVAIVIVLLLAALAVALTR